MLFNYRNMKTKMVARRVILFLIRYQRRPLPNVDKNPEDEGSGEDVPFTENEDKNGSKKTVIVLNSVSIKTSAEC